MTDTTNYLIVSAVCGVLLAFIKVLYDSKCVKVKLCCGIAEIERDIETEFKEDEQKYNDNNDKQNIISAQNLRFGN